MMSEIAVNTSKTLSSFGSMIFLIIVLIKNFPIAVLLNKKGIEYWKGFIPIYNNYLLFKIYWEVKYFICLIILFIGFIVLVLVGAILMNPMGFFIGIPIILFALILFGFMLYIVINFYVHLAKAHEKTGWFVVGLLFLNIVFYYFLAFDKQIQKFFNSIK